MESFDFQYVTTNKEQDACYEDEHGKHLKRSNKNVVKPTKEAQRSVAASSAIDDNLEHFDVDDDKANIDENVKESSDGTAYHLALTESDSNHGFPSICFTVGTIDIPSEQNISTDLFYS